MALKSRLRMASGFYARNLQHACRPADFLAFGSCMDDTTVGNLLGTRLVLNELSHFWSLAQFHARIFTRS